jgi:hypothetical protein
MMLRQARRYHQALMLFAGLQFFVWSVTGLYMVLINIHSIHGEDFTIQQQPLLSKSFVNENNDNNNKEAWFSINKLIKVYPDASNIKLAWLADKAVYRFKTSSGNKLLYAHSGNQVTEISKELAIQVALSHLREPLKVEKAHLITQNPPSEIGSRALPLWRIDFAGINSPTFYIDHQSGKLLTVRQNSWRLFDLFWRLHIMDYIEGEDVNNVLLNIFSVTGLLAALSGLVLLALRLFSSKSAEPAV